MKTKLEKKYLVGVMLLVAVFFSTPTTAAVYTYDSDVANWFTGSGNLPGWTTREYDGVFLQVDTLTTNALRVTNVNTVWTILPGNYSGGIWVAPENEIITSVQITFTGLYSDVGAPNIYLYAGVDDVSTMAWEADPLGDVRLVPQTRAIDLSDYEYNQIFLRNWYNGSSVNKTLQTGWASTAHTVVITTIPEPATMSMLGLGGLALLRRKRRQTTK